MFHSVFPSLVTSFNVCRDFCLHQT